MKTVKNRVAVEQWTVRADDKRLHPEGRRVVTKVAVRVAKGQPLAGTFHGATNFKGSVLGE